MNSFKEAVQKYRLVEKFMLPEDKKEAQQFLDYLAANRGDVADYHDYSELVYPYELIRDVQSEQLRETMIAMLTKLKEYERRIKRK